MNTIYNIKVSFLCCFGKILMNLQISKKTYIIGEIIILKLKFGTKRKNRKLCLISWGLNQILVGTDHRHVPLTFNGMLHENTHTGPLKRSLSVL